jgi:hypothetical protein
MQKWANGSGAFCGCSPDLHCAMFTVEKQPYRFAFMKCPALMIRRHLSAVGLPSRRGAARLLWPPRSRGRRGPAADAWSAAARTPTAATELPILHLPVGPVDPWRIHRRLVLELGVETHEEYAAQCVVGVVDIFIAAAVDVIDDRMIQKRRVVVEGIVDTGAQRIVLPHFPRRR